MSDAVPQAGDFERIPKWLNLIPMVAQWLWLGLRHGSVSLPSAVNPHISTGGLVGEGKLEYFAIMGTLARAATADFIAVAGDATEATVLGALRDAGIEFPVVVKPDIGWCGYGVRLIASAEALAAYRRVYPADATLVVQRYIADEGEAGLFYVRGPDEAQGRVIGVLLRYFPAVTGDGRRCLADLVAADVRLRRLIGDDRHEAAFDPDHVPARGETTRLALIGSTRVGGLYLDGTEHVTARLTARLDAIARDMREFRVGRFDVRFASLASLRSGDFTIMEVNGAGSEAVHAWDPRYSIAEVYKIVFAKQRLLFAVAAACRAAGGVPCGVLTLTRRFLAQRRLIRRYPRSN